MRAPLILLACVLAILWPRCMLAAPGPSCLDGVQAASTAHDGHTGNLTHQGRTLMKRLPAGTSIDVLVEIPFAETRSFYGSVGWNSDTVAAQPLLPTAIWSRRIPDDHPFVLDGNGWARGQTLLSFELPQTFSSVGREVAITLVACAAQTPDSPAQPEFVVRLNAPTSAKWFCIILSVVAVSFSYLAATVARSRMLKEKHTLDPIVLTAGWDGRGSPAKLQVLFFSLIVIGLLTYILSRAGLLSDLSLTVLMLLGISSVGALASRGTDMHKNRLDYDNWAWLIRKGWLTVTGLAGKRPPQWADLFTIQGEFDVSRFQLVFFSLVVGVALLQIGLTDLATFTIPQALLGLLGLSQATYVLGKAVGPDDVDSLDKAIRNLRALEDAFVLKAGTQDDPKPALGCDAGPPPSDIESARRRAGAEYGLYMQKEQEMRTMFEASYGIPLDPLVPRFV